MKKIEEIPPILSRPKDAHKGNFGRVLILAGSKGMIGAAYLATKACMRSGAGLVTLGVPESLLPIAASKLTCAMTYPFHETNQQTFSSKSVRTIINFAKDFDVVAIGPGLSQNLDTQEMVRQLIPSIDLPIVIDADALNALIGHTDLLKYRSHTTIITPHPGEFSRLTEISVRDIAKNKLDISSDFAEEHNCIVVLKFAPTIVTDGKMYFINTTGNPGMATGGSGDVLTGIISGLLKQRFNAFQAAQFGVYIHGYAGDLACDEYGEIGMIATDILDKLPYAFKYYHS